MRAISLCVALALGLLFGPVQGLTATNADAAEKTDTDWLYEELMARVLNDEYTWAPSGSNNKKGQRNSYREGVRGYSHKALAACLIWDSDRLRVDYKHWHAAGNRDWSNAAFVAIRSCNKFKEKEEADCKCQVIDQDDENRLKVPEEFLKKYERKFSG